MASRPWPMPNMERTIHFLGDIHFGSITTGRKNKLQADILRLPTPLAHVHLGDFVQDDAQYFSTGVDWMNALPADWYTATGNHDLWDNFQTPAEFATETGMPGQNFTVDLGFVTLIFVNPDEMAEEDNTTITLSATTLTWLEDQLEATTQDCWIVCHAPLKDTVVGDTEAVWSSAEAGFYVQPNTTIRTLLNSHTNAKAWISGHTHSPTDTSGFIKSESVGTRNIAAINCSGLQYVGRTNEWYDDIKSLYLTHTDDAIEVRVRNHGAGVWDAISLSRTTTVAA